MCVHVNFFCDQYFDLPLCITEFLLNNFFCSKTIGLYLQRFCPAAGQHMLLRRAGAPPTLGMCALEFIFCLHLLLVRSFVCVGRAACGYVCMYVSYRSSFPIRNMSAAVLHHQIRCAFEIACVSVCVREFCVRFFGYVRV